jgi:hypothetical protein
MFTLLTAVLVGGTMVGERRRLQPTGSTLLYPSSRWLRRFVVRTLSRALENSRNTPSHGRRKLPLISPMRMGSLTFYLIHSREGRRSTWMLQRPRPNGLPICSHG